MEITELESLQNAAERINPYLSVKNDNEHTFKVFFKEKIITNNLDYENARSFLLGFEEGLKR